MTAEQQTRIFLAGYDYAILMAEQRVANAEGVDPNPNMERVAHGRAQSVVNWLKAMRP